MTEPNTPAITPETATAPVAAPSHQTPDLASTAPAGEPAPVATDAPPSDNRRNKGGREGDRQNNRGNPRRAGAAGQRRGGPAARDGGGRNAARNRPPAKPLHPVLGQLAGLYPALFGPRLVPLKRGILQDLLAAQPEALNKDGLKEALAIHTRSTRYLHAMASGQPRQDLNGQAVEPVAPEHRYHAIVELYRRRVGKLARQPEGTDTAAAQQHEQRALHAHIVAAALESGLSAADYALAVRTKDETANAVLDQAVAEVAERLAKDQALLQAFEASGKTVTAFADMYGLHPIEAAATLNRARARTPAA